MLNSFHSGIFQLACLQFLNTFVKSASSPREMVQIQAEIEEAGFDLNHLQISCSQLGNHGEMLKAELDTWSKNYVDVNALVTDKLLMQQQLESTKRELEVCRAKILSLESSNKVLKDKVKDIKNIEPRWMAEGAS